MPAVRITRRYRSARPPYALSDAVSDAGWAGLVARIETAGPVRIEPYASDDEEGLVVTTEDHRGPCGAVAIHNLACCFGALAVIE